MAKALHACAPSSRGQSPKGYFAANFVDLRSVTLRSTIQYTLVTMYVGIDCSRKCT